MVDIHMPPWSENVQSTLDYQQFTFSANCDKKRRKGYEVEKTDFNLVFVKTMVQRLLEKGVKGILRAKKGELRV